jgi:D-xylose 1-dehydrogenase (NADP+, D-xylono-1,5-lactone-forming)
MRVGDEMSLVRFGVLGIGKIARTRFLPAAARAAGVRVTALGTRQVDSLSRVSLPLSEQPRFLDYADLVAAGREIVDAVYIALPNDLHVEWIERCAGAGLHVLCEKPLSGDCAGALRAKAASDAAGVLLAEGFMYRFDPRHQLVRQLVTAGELGDIRFCRAHFSYPLDDLNNIRLQSDRQGGALADVGCYGVDVLRFLLGVEPLTVSARCHYGVASKVDELTIVGLGFPSGIEAVIVASTRLARRHEYQIFGSRGTVLVPNAFVPPDQEQTEIIIENEGGRVIKQFPPFAPFIAEIEHFASAVTATVRKVPPPAEDGLANSAVLTAIRQALRLGGTVEVHHAPGV